MFWVGFGAGCVLLVWGVFRSARSWGGFCTYWLVTLIVLLVTAMIWPNPCRPRCNPAGPCIANLKRIEGAIATWAKDHGKALTDVPLDSDLFGETNYIPIKPTCHMGGTYWRGAVRDRPRCSIEGHELAGDGPPPREPMLSKHDRIALESLGCGAGVVLVSAMLLTGWRHWRGRSKTPAGCRSGSDPGLGGKCGRHL